MASDSNDDNDNVHGNNDSENAIRAIAEGAWLFCQKPADPELLGLINTNDPASYRDALKRAGLPVPPDMESIFDPQD